MKVFELISRLMELPAGKDVFIQLDSTSEVVVTGYYFDEAEDRFVIQGGDTMVWDENGEWDYLSNLVDERNGESEDE